MRERGPGGEMTCWEICLHLKQCGVLLMGSWGYLCPCGETERLDFEIVAHFARHSEDELSHHFCAMRLRGAFPGNPYEQ